MVKAFLIVDEPHQKKLIEDFVADQPTEIEFELVSSIQTALESTRSNSPDLIVADTSSIDNIDELLQAFPATPIVLLVERSDSQQAFDALNSGVYDFLIKDQAGMYLKAIEPAIAKTIAIFKEREVNRKKTEELQHELHQTLNNLEKETSSHKSTLLELLKSNEIYRNLIETSSDRTWEIDLDLKYVFCSSQVFNMLGYSQKETLGKTPFDFMADKEAIKARDAYQSYYKLQKQFDLMENIFLHRDGHEVILETNAAPLFTSSGKLKGFRGVDRDVTTRKTVREKLKKTLKMQKIANDLMRVSLEPAVFKEQLQHALDLILACDIEGLQKKGAVFIVEDETSMLKLQVHRNFSEEHLALCSKIPFGTCLCGRAAESKKVTGLRHENETHDIKIKGSESHNHCCIPILRGDQILGLINLYLDINHGWGLDEEGFMLSLGQSMASIIVKHKSDEKNRMLQAQVAHKKKMETVSRLAGGIAHDFNNALTVISGYSQLILMDCEKNSSLCENAEIISDSSKKAADLIRQLLTFSQEQKIVLRKVSLNDILDELSDAIRTMAGENVLTTFKQAEDLWDINIDYGQMDHMILNIVENAQDALEKNGGNLFIETKNITFDHEFVRTHHGVKPGEYVLISFKDDGPGMSPEVIEKVFEPFFSTKREKGNGLGLATVYGIVKQNGGNIYASSELGRGAEIKVYLPKYSEDKEQSGAGMDDPELKGGNETILVVDDEKEVLHYCERVLGKLGYNLMLAEDGAQALEYYENHGDSIDLLLTDVYMPRIDGIELAAKLRNRQKDIRVLYMSGFADNPEVNKDIMTKGANYMSKPISPQRLASAVRMILDMPPFESDNDQN